MHKRISKAPFVRAPGYAKLQELEMGGREGVGGMGGGRVVLFTV